MKTQQIEMLADLGKCWMTQNDRFEFDWFRFTDKSWHMDRDSANELRRLWNRYRMQIRHNRRGDRKR